MSLESWIDISIAALALIVLTSASLVDATHARKQRLTIRELLESGNNTSNADKTVDQPLLVRSAMDVAALVSMLAIGVTLTRFGLREFGWGGALFALITGVLTIVIFGRVVPAAVADRVATADSGVVRTMASVLRMLVLPVTGTADLALSLLASLTERSERGSDSGNGESSSDQVTNGSENEFDDIHDDEQEMISGILGMDEASAREIMVPRPDVIAVPAEMSIPEVVEVAREAGHSRIPVYSESIDSIRGVVYAKDLLRFVTDEVGDVRLQDLVRPAVFVPESKRVDDLLRELRRSKVHMAVVVDEYGGTAGIVTIEDIIEEIVGEIQDEYDRELPLYQFGATGEITVDGRMGVDELAELIGIDLPETESETLGGFVQRVLGHIPEAGETVQAGHVAIRVEAVERRRVTTLTVSTLEDPESIETANPIRAS